MNERLASSKHHVQYDTCAPYINFLIVTLLGEDLRRRELNSSGLCHELLVIMKSPWDIEVNDQ